MFMKRWGAIWLKRALDKYFILLRIIYVRNHKSQNDNPTFDTPTFILIQDTYLNTLTISGVISAFALTSCAPGLLEGSTPGLAGPRTATNATLVMVTQGAPPDHTSGHAGTSSILAIHRAATS